jgi:hypothetical protein
MKSKAEENEGSFTLELTPVKERNKKRDLVTIEERSKKKQLEAAACNRFV